ncbi:hypothetical protein TNCV_988331 [Trichonephila clavipes]|nr:hypothetical protein TNCV_988331 [Trichonephila clavipes]
MVTKPPKTVAKSPKWSPKNQNRSPKSTPTWLNREYFAKFPFKCHYSSTYQEAPSQSRPLRFKAQIPFDMGWWNVSRFPKDVKLLVVSC